MLRFRARKPYTNVQPHPPVPALVEQRQFRDYDVAGRCAGADEIKLLPGRTQKYSGKEAGNNVALEFAVTVAVVSTVAQIPPVKVWITRICLVCVPKFVVLWLAFV
jgi:hypothetical protein